VRDVLGCNQIGVTNNFGFGADCFRRRKF
jgi:hypothetical protein